MSQTRYVSGPNVITEDGMFHFNGPVGKSITVDGRMFPVTWKSAGKYCETFYQVNGRQYTSCGKTRAYPSAYIHMSLFPDRPAAEWIASRANNSVIVARGADWRALQYSIGRYLVANGLTYAELTVNNGRAYTAFMAPNIHNTA